MPTKILTSFLRNQMFRVPVVAQWKWTQLVSVRMRVWLLALLNGLRIRSCCGYGVGQQLQLLFNPYPRNFHLPHAQSWKAKKKKKKERKKRKEKKPNILNLGKEKCQRIRLDCIFFGKGIYLQELQNQRHKQCKFQSVEVWWCPSSGFIAV